MPQALLQASAQRIAWSYASRAMHVRTYVLTNNYLRNVGFLTLVTARKKPRISPEPEPLMADRHLDDDGHVLDNPETGRAAITDCTLCDGDGYRGPVVCDHVNRVDIHRRGIEKVRRAMGWTEEDENAEET